MGGQKTELVFFFLLSFFSLVVVSPPSPYIRAGNGNTHSFIRSDIFLVCFLHSLRVPPSSTKTIIWSIIHILRDPYGWKDVKRIRLGTNEERAAFVCRCLVSVSDEYRDEQQYGCRCSRSIDKASRHRSIASTTVTSTRIRTRFSDVERDSPSSSDSLCLSTWQCPS